MNLLLKVNKTDLKKYRLENKNEIEIKDLERQFLMNFAKESLKNTKNIAIETGLSEMSLDDINNEIKESRFE